MNKQLTTRNWSLQLVQVRGIPIRVHWSFFALLVWIGFSTEGGPRETFMSIALIVALFSCVLLHELGHALVALRNGISTRDITLYVIGGVASLTAQPSAGAELRIALAGPLVNVLIAGILYPFVSLGDASLGDSSSFLVAGASLSAFINELFISNLFLAIFNMLPALPMDGGRVLRALLALANIRRATTIAARTSQALCIVMGIFGLLNSSPILILIAGLIFTNATREESFAKIVALAPHWLVRDVMTKASEITCFSHGTPLSQALNSALRTFQPFYPVLNVDTVLGAIERDILLREATIGEEEAYVAALMDREFPCIDSASPLHQLIEHAQTHRGIGYLVVDEGKLVGIVARDRLMEFIMVEGLRSKESVSSNASGSLANPERE